MAEVGRTVPAPDDDPKARAALRRRAYEKWRNDARNAHAQFFSIFSGFLDYLDKSRKGRSKPTSTAGDKSRENWQRLSSTDIRLYIYLGLRSNRSGELWYGVDRIARDLGLGERTVQRSLDNLKKAGLIDRIQYSPTSVARTFLIPYNLDPAPRSDEVSEPSELPDQLPKQERDNNPQEVE